MGMLQQTANAFRQSRVLEVMELDNDIVRQTTGIFGKERRFCTLNIANHQASALRFHQVVPKEFTSQDARAVRSSRQIRSRNATGFLVYIKSEKLRPGEQCGKSREKHPALTADVVNHTVVPRGPATNDALHRKLVCAEKFR